MMKKLVLLFTCFLISGCSTFQNCREDSAQKVVVRMINAIDTKNWDQALDQFEKEVFVDYSSMSG